MSFSEMIETRSAKIFMLGMFAGMILAGLSWKVGELVAMIAIYLS